MKTLHLTNAWHATSGGIGTFYKALFETAEREGHEVRLVAPGTETRVEQIGRFVRIYYLKAPRAPVNSEYRLLYPHRFLFPGTAIQRIVNREQPDLIEVSEKYTMPYLAGLLRTRRLPGVKVRPTVVGTSHERMDENMAAYFSRRPGARSFCRSYMKWVYFPMFDHHITVSEHTAEELIEASHGHKVRRGIWVAPMGADCDRFTPERRSPKVRAELLRVAGGDGNSTVLLYAGRLAPEKNLPLLVDTVRRLDPSEYRLVIAGEGPDLEGLRARCRAAGIENVAFPGHIRDRDLLAGYYANADVFIHPNPREPFGIAPLEAMSAGLALVAPDSGGVTSYAHSGNAWLAKPNGEAFASAVRSIRAGPDLRMVRTAEARRTAENYRWSKVTSRYLTLYRQLDALTQGQIAEPAMPPHSYSTPGDAFGRELTRS